MTLQEIEQAVDNGKTVYWVTELYTVIKDKAGEYLIQCIKNDYYTALSCKAGTLQGKEADFFTIELLLSSAKNSLETCLNVITDMGKIIRYLDEDSAYSHYWLQDGNKNEPDYVPGMDGIRNLLEKLKQFSNA